MSTPIDHGDLRSHVSSSLIGSLGFGRDHPVGIVFRIFTRIVWISGEAQLSESRDIHVVEIIAENCELSHLVGSDLIRIQLRKVVHLTSLNLMTPSLLVPATTVMILLLCVLFTSMQNLPSDSPPIEVSSSV